MSNDIDICTTRIIDYIFKYNELKEEYEPLPSNYSSILKKEVKEIFKNNYGYLLTDNIIEYIVFESLYISYANNKKNIFLENILIILRRIKLFEFNDAVNYISNYFRTLRNHYPIIYYLFDIDKHIKLMDDDTRDMFYKYQEIINKLSDYDEGASLLSSILDDSLAYAIVANNKKIFDEIIDNYFTNIEETLDIFRINGLLDEDYINDYNFFEFIKLNIKNELSLI